MLSLHDALPIERRMGSPLWVLIVCLASLPRCGILALAGVGASPTRGTGQMFDGFLTLPVLAVGAFFAVSYFVNPETIIIEEISVPLYLEYRGFNNEVATGLLTEEVAKIAHAATDRKSTLLNSSH